MACTSFPPCSPPPPKGIIKASMVSLIWVNRIVWSNNCCPVVLLTHPMTRDCWAQIWSQSCIRPFQKLDSDRKQFSQEMASSESQETENHIRFQSNGFEYASLGLKVLDPTVFYSVWGFFCFYFFVPIMSFFTDSHWISCAFSWVFQNVPIQVQVVASRMFLNFKSCAVVLLMGTICNESDVN